MNVELADAANALRSGSIKSFEVRRELLHKIAGDIFGSDSVILKRIAELTTESEAAAGEIQNDLLALIKSDVSAVSGPAAAPPADDAVINRIAANFSRSIFGQAVKFIIVLAVSMMALALGVSWYQTAGLLKIKQAAETAAAEAKTTSDSAKHAAADAIASIQKDLADTDGMKAKAVAEATPRIVEKGVAALAGAKIEDQVVTKVKADADLRIKALNDKLDAIGKSVSGMENVETEIVQARGEVQRFKADAATWRESVEAQKGTINDTAFNKLIWSVLGIRSLVLIVTATAAVLAAVLAGIAWTRVKATKRYVINHIGAPSG